MEEKYRIRKRIKGKYKNGTPREVLDKIINGKVIETRTLPTPEELWMLMCPVISRGNVSSSDGEMEQNGSQKFVHDILTVLLEKLKIGHLDTNFFSYLAGFIDGEGCFSMRTIERIGKLNPEGREFKNNEHKVCVTLTNTNKKILEEVKDKLNLGGTLHMSHKEGVCGNNKEAWQLKYYNQQAYLLCKLIEPFLKIKKEQCNLILNFYERKAEYFIDETEKKRRNELIQKSKELNKRGIEEKTYIPDFKPVEVDKLIPDLDLVKKKLLEEK
jgi:hypothetical protein